MQLDFQNMTNSKEQIVAVIGNFWQKIYKYVFSFFLLSAIVFSAYIWNRGLYGGTWSDEKKSEYVSAQGGGVVFNEASFKKALADVEARKQENLESKESIKDIFKEYQ